jgi:hypothetical protein
LGMVGWWWLRPDLPPLKKRAALVDAVFSSWDPEEGDDRERLSLPQLRGFPS